MENSVDLAALDALYQAATKQREWRDEVQRLAGHPDDQEMSDAKSAEAHYADLIVEIVRDELDLPALRRRLEIGDAAVEVVDTEAKAKAAARLVNMHALDLDKLVPPKEAVDAQMAWVTAYDAECAARARLRALREAQNG